LQFDYKALLQEAKLLRVQPDDAGANSWDMDMVPIRSPSSQLEPADPALDAESDDGQGDVRVEVVTLTLERPKTKGQSTDISSSRNFSSRDRLQKFQLLAQECVRFVHPI
jgi:hypothetical protein